MKKFIAIIIATLMTLTVVSCGKNGDSNDTTKGTDKDVPKQTENDNKSGSTPVAKVNEPFVIKTESGEYTLTFEKVRTTDQRNSMSEKTVKKVIFLDYTYSNTNFDSGSNLILDPTSFSILDDEGNVLDTYPVSDENREIKEVPVGGKCQASAAYALKTDSKNIKVTFERSGSQDELQRVCTITLPIE